MSDTPRLIGLAGYARSGKDTVARRLVAEHGFAQVAFADALKDVLTSVDPFVTVDGLRLSDIGSIDEVKLIDEGRRLLQALGQAVRDRVARDVWVEVAMRDVRAYRDAGSPVVVSDVRYRNEAAAIHAAGGEVWYIARHGNMPVNGHLSEVDITPGLCEHVVGNNHDIDSLYATVDWLLGAPTPDPYELECECGCGAYG